MSEALTPRPGPATIALDLRWVVNTTAQAAAEAIAQRQSERLALLLQAASRTRYYGRLLHGLDPLTTPLSALPVMDKPQLMAHFADHVVNPALSLTGLRAFCANPARVGEPCLGRYWVWESSGSTGQPGIFVQDDTAMLVYDALEASRRHSPRPWVRLLDPNFLRCWAGATTCWWCPGVMAHPSPCCRWP